VKRGELAGRRIRVAFIDQQGDEAGGAEESLALLLQHLPSTIEPSVVTFTEGRYAQRLREAGLDVTTVPIGGPIAVTTRERPSLRAGAAVPLAALRLATHLAEQKVDVVHTNTMKAHLIGGVAAKMLGRPSVIHLRDIVEGNARRVVALTARACTRRRIAISRAVADCYALPGTIVVENPLDLVAYDRLEAAAPAREQLSLPAGVPLVAIVGRINRWKGHDRFLRAAAFTAARTDAHFLIAGEARFRDADFVPELHALVTALGLDGRVTFLPWIDDPRVLYAAIDLHVNCATREPFGRTTIEAAAAGVPTVCFDDSGVSEFISSGTSALVVPAGDEAALADAMTAYVASPELRRRAGLAARVWARRFDARTHAERVARILLSASAPGR
jgi:glycosyltransferase involved in cell wall biosynthesis